MAPFGATVKGYSGSGFFLDSPNALNQPVYSSQMQAVFTFQNLSDSVNQGCIENNPSMPWLCIFAPTTYAYVKSPMMIVNADYDLWQLVNILGVNDDSFEDCSNNGPQGCTADQMDQVNAYANEMLDQMTGSPGASRPYNGIFIHSCWTHGCETDSGCWEYTEIDGVSIANAVASW